MQVRERYKAIDPLFYLRAQANKLKEKTTNLIEEHKQIYMLVGKL